VKIKILYFSLISIIISCGPSKGEKINLLKLKIDRLLELKKDNSLEVEKINNKKTNALIKCIYR
jgi:ribosomal protein S3